MRPLTAHNKSQGFTLIEQLIIILIVGILASMVAPSFQGMYNRTRVNEAVTTVRGALQEAQREAMRKSKSCSITINTTDRTIANTTANDACLVTGPRTLPNQVTMAVTGGTNATILYDFRGNTNTGNIIRISPSQGNQATKCVELSIPLGIVRSGTYNATNTTCQ